MAFDIVTSISIISIITITMIITKQYYRGLLYRVISDLNLNIVLKCIFKEKFLLAILESNFRAGLSDSLLG